MIWILESLGDVIMDENKDILVSVIVPVYNTKNYLEACLKSIVSQSYKRLDFFQK